MATIDTVRELILKLKKTNITAADLTPEARFAEDLSFDSQDLTEVLVLVEEAFKIDIDFQEASQMTNIATAVEYIEQKQGK